MYIHKNLFYNKIVKIWVCVILIKFINKFNFTLPFLLLKFSILSFVPIK